MLLNRSTIANANAICHLFNKPMLALYMGVCCPSRKLPVDEKWIPVAKKGHERRSLDDPECSCNECISILPCLGFNMDMRTVSEEERA